MSVAMPTSAAESGAEVFESVRDYVGALERRGRLLRVEAMDQDQYEATAFAYRLIDRFGIEYAPAFLIERIRIGGKWIDGPVRREPLRPLARRGAAVRRLAHHRRLPGDVPRRHGRAARPPRRRRQLAPHPARRGETPREAPCKEVVLKGDEVDLEKFAWLKNNPADAGRYVNMGSVFIQDPAIGSNVGTYRCQVKGPRKMAVNPEPGQHGWRILMAMKERGDKIAKVAVAVGPDPMTFCASSTKMAGYLEDELEFAGGLRGKPLPVVKCETCDIRVPAHSEFIIEGEVPLTEFEDEGPYGEMYGYLGPTKPNNFFMNIKAITHRQQALGAQLLHGPHLRHAPRAADRLQLLHVQEADPEPDRAHLAARRQRRRSSSASTRSSRARAWPRASTSPPTRA